MNAVAAAGSMLLTPPLSLYMHFPWCVSKCPYCDFNSHALQGPLASEAYLARLARDLEAQAPAVRGREVSTVFFGGGTPSLFAPEAIGRVLENVRRHLALAADAEVTLEANPGTIERGAFRDYRAAGVTRVSLGAQSFDAQILKTLGRIHSPQETQRAAEELHAAGLANFNLDLMYAARTGRAGGAARRRGGAGACAGASVRTTSSRWNRAPCSPRGRPCCPTMTPRRTCAWARAPNASASGALREARCRRTRARNAVPPQSQLLEFRRLPGRGRRCAQTHLQRARRDRAHHAAARTARYLAAADARTLTRRQVAGMNCRSSSCLTRCACARASRGGCSASVPGSAGQIAACCRWRWSVVLYLRHRRGLPGRASWAYGFSTKRFAALHGRNRANDQ
jgi:hypothetical protein